MFIKKLALLALLLIAGASAGFMRGGVPVPVPGLLNTWLTMEVVAGGYIRGIDIQCDSTCAGSGTTTKLARPDGYGLYKRITSGSCTVNVAAPCWQQIVTSASLPPGDPMNNAGIACLNFTCSPWDARIAPSNTQVFYMQLGGYVYKTVNAGAAWTATAFSQDTASDPNGNNGVGQAGPKIAIDPVDPTHVIVCRATTGCFYSTDSGATVHAITGMTNSGVLSTVAFDQNTSSGGSTPNIYICQNGTGCYKTTGGITSSTWTLLNASGFPTTALHILIDQTGLFWVVDNSGGGGGNVLKWNGTAWSTVIGSQCCESIAIDPANAAHIVAVNTGGQPIVSFNSGGSFTGAQTITLAASDAPWLVNSGTFMTAGNIVYDPAQSNVVYMGAGAGVWSMTPTTGTTVTWNSQNIGIENLTAIEIMSPPGGVPVVSGWDYQAFMVPSPNTPASASNRGTQAIDCCRGVWGMDYASSSPSTLMFLDNTNNGSSPAEISGLSSNSGTNWNSFAGFPTGTAANYGGSIAASSPSVAVWITAQNGVSGKGQLFATTDGGATWGLQSISGIATTNTIGWYDNYYLNRIAVCADRSASNTFYAVNEGSSGSTAGVYKGVWSGSAWTWTRAKTGAIDGGTSNNGKIKCVPSNAGAMYWTSGNVTDTTLANYPHAQSFFECTDSAGTVTCAAMANVKEVWNFGFGAAKPGGSGYPSLYIIGWVTQNAGVSYTFGIWRTTDHGTNWTNLGIPLTYLDNIVSVSGDMNTYGPVYVGYHTGGRAYGTFP